MSARKDSPDVGYLVFGLLFLGLATSWWLTDIDVLDADDRWIVPAILLGAGALGLIASIARGLRRDTSSDEDLGSTPEPTPKPTPEPTVELTTDPQETR